MNHHEAVEFKKLEAIDDGLLADAGQPRNAVERRAHLAIVKGEGSGHESTFYAPFARTNGELMRPESNFRFVAV